MPRRPANLLAALSLLLCLASCALRLRSLFTQDAWGYARASAGPGRRLRRTTEIGCNRGELVVSETDPWSLATDDTGNQINANRSARKHPGDGLRGHTSDTKGYRWNPARPGDTPWRRLGFQGQYLLDVRPVPDLGYTQRSLLWRVAIPLRLPALLTAFPCALWLIHRRTRRRLTRLGHCPTCTTTSAPPPAAAPSAEHRRPPRGSVLI